MSGSSRITTWQIRRIWSHFFAGSNCFKGVHDGFGGIVKRYIARYILQDNSHAITNAVEMIDALSKKKLGYGEEVRIKRFE